MIMGGKNGGLWSWHSEPSKYQSIVGSVMLLLNEIQIPINRQYIDDG